MLCPADFDLCVSRSFFRVASSFTSRTLSGQVSQFPPLRIIGRPMSSSSVSTNCGHLQGKEPGYVSSPFRSLYNAQHAPDPRNVRAMALVRPAQHSRKACPDPRVVPLGLLHSFRRRRGDPQEGIRTEIGGNPVCTGLKEVTAVRAELWGVSLIS